MNGCSIESSDSPRSSMSRGLAKYSGTMGMFSGVDILPNIHFGPIRKRKNAQALARVDARIKYVPEFGALIAGIPLAASIAERKYPFFGARTFFIAARASDGRGEIAFTQSIEQRGRFQSAAAALGAPVERICAFDQGTGVGMDDEFHAQFSGISVAELNHFLEFVAGIDV